MIRYYTEGGYIFDAEEDNVKHEGGIVSLTTTKGTSVTIYRNRIVAWEYIDTTSISDQFATAGATS